MTADERANSDRRERGSDSAQDAREEYTAYRETDPDEGTDPEAEREAERQPAEAEEEQD